MALSLSLLTTSELSTLIKRAPETLVRWRRLRVGPPFLVIEGRVLYDEGEVRLWLDARRASSTPERPKNAQTKRPASQNANDQLPLQQTPDPVGQMPGPGAQSIGFAFDQYMEWQTSDVEGLCGSLSGREP